MTNRPVADRLSEILNCKNDLFRTTDILSQWLKDDGRLGVGGGEGSGLGRGGGVVTQGSLSHRKTISLKK